MSKLKLSKANLPYHVFDAAGCKHADCSTAYDAAFVAGHINEGGYIKYGRRVVWTEGDKYDGFAGDSWDSTVDTIYKRIDA